MSKNFRWTCPNGCPAVLGPSKLRKIDVRRYCLSCSEAKGLLVDRVVPKLENAREAARKRSQAKAARKAAVKRERERPERERVKKALRVQKTRERDLARIRKRYTRHVDAEPTAGYAPYEVTQENVVDRYRQLGVTVLTCHPGRPVQAGYLLYVPLWAVHIMYELKTFDSKPTEAHRVMIADLVRWVARRKRLVDAVFAASVIRPIYGVALALDHYKGVTPAGFKDHVRGVAGWRGDDEEDRFVPMPF